MKYKVAILLLGFFIVAVSAFSQNLVLNPSFEEYGDCIYNDRKIYYYDLKVWEHPTKGIPNYYNACDTTGEFSVPRNFEGNMPAKSGVGYIGLILYANKSNFREYIQGELSKSLDSGKQYLVQFYVAPTFRSGYRVNNIGAYLSKERIQKKTYRELKLIPQVNYSSDSLIDNIKEWKLISGIYTATGGERYITIGNFKTNKEIKIKDVSGTNMFYTFEAMYFIDDVSVTLIE